MTSALAMFGGPRTVNRKDIAPESIEWPIVTAAEKQAVLRVLETGGFTSVGAGGREVGLLEQEWADFTGVAHCVAVASGTAAIELMLAALGIEPGAEILVPALSFIASATAPARRLLVPVFVDIDPASFNIDPAAAAAAITPRTQAILAVHLHGLPCDMAELRQLADSHGLVLVEDSAQAHGARYRGRSAGGLGDAAAFSLNASKNLPTCGEGGLVTTPDANVAEAVRLHRQFGEDLDNGRDYISRVLAGNAKLSTINAAFTRCQLSRFPERQQAREANTGSLLARLADLPGLVVPRCPPDRSHTWHIVRLRFDVTAMGYPDLTAGAMRSLLQRALRAEGVPVRSYQQVPLPCQPALREQAGFGGYPWRLAGTTAETGRAEDFPHTLAVLEDSLTLQQWHLNPASKPVLDRCAAAFEKVWEHLGPLATIAEAMEYSPAWRSPSLMAEE